MATNQKPTPPQEVASHHLALRLDDRRPPELRFGFETAQSRFALTGTLLSHGALVLVWFLLVWIIPEPIRQAILPDALSRQIVWLAEPGPGGGGGGGNQSPDPPRQAELKGQEEVTVPALPEPEPTPEPEPPAPVEQLTIPAETLAASTENVPGVIESAAVSESTGSGSGGGGGSGFGSGLGQGSGGGTGGGVYRPGSGVINPRILREVKPQYTADAMRAKVQGTVLLECVVLPDGTVGRVDVVKSLDPTFGLDAEAVKAAKQWRFQPGTKSGEPVAVLVTIELTFTLR
jgi:TonB family protein